MKVGDVVFWERTFTTEDVNLFSKVSGDEGVHHVIPDEQGRLVIQGLLTATLPTKIGGDFNVLARKISFEFLRPVFTGDRIRCEVVIEQYEEKNDRTYMATNFVCRNQHEKEVMTGQFSGVILHHQNA
ncbi:MaoC/PaaZ C-terminal domain-containing protein [Aneurinibacillus tyrosinisolvens]|uniref:MaoC/PaaZ C-terminal domain-containing protein n=1 Tax=Aneurinibacillus tyrosinisolvens TaxID=1443435 RepID=UPI000A710DBC|nr:MaoC/PaaZ C-terminal domain-containing protein [Aneurinibacillus tyrosinisolvens]